MKKVVNVVNLRGGYETPLGFVRAVDGCSLEVYEREIVGIAGESGCGKSTFARLMIGYVKPPAYVINGTSIIGDINVYSLPWEERRRRLWGVKVSLIPQYSMNALNPTKKIRDIIVDVVRERKGKSISSREALAMAKARLEELGLSEEVLNMYPIELSGGMKQRTVIAISTLLNPLLLIADEPTSALDVSTQKLLLFLLYELVKRRGIVETLIFISHDIATLRQICDRLYIMYAGRIVEVGGIEEVLKNPLHPYTKGLIRAVISLQPEVRGITLRGIPGSPPDLINPPKGCRFAPRCPSAKDKCKEEPPLINVGGRRLVACWLYD